LPPPLLPSSVIFFLVKSTTALSPTFSFLWKCPIYLSAARGHFLVKASLNSNFPFSCRPRFLSKSSADMKFPASLFFSEARQLTVSSLDFFFFMLLEIQASSIDCPLVPQCPPCEHLPSSLFSRPQYVLDFGTSFQLLGIPFSLEFPQHLITSPFWPSWDLA